MPYNIGQTYVRIPVYQTYFGDEIDDLFKNWLTDKLIFYTFTTHTLICLKNKRDEKKG